MGQLKLSGSITSGPPVVTDTSFPSSSLAVQLGTQTSPKSFGACSGVLQQTIDSPGSFVTLGGVNATSGPVKQGDFLYLRSDSKIDVRITHDDGAGGSTQVVIPIHGVLILEFQDTKFLKTLEAKGSALLEYLISGPS